MSFQALPTLQHLTIQLLLNNEDLAVSALEDLPSVLFPPLFKEAFTKRRRKLVKHLVLTWPYPKLYIGPLKYNFDVYSCKTVYDGIDWLRNQKVWPGRCRLKELYLLDATHDFLIIMNPGQDHLCTPQPQGEEEDPTTVLRQPVTVYADSAFMADHLKGCRDILEEIFNDRFTTMSLNFKEMDPQKAAQIQGVRSLGIYWNL
ncbi:PRAME family member 18-like [Mus pahari]|uniref:PRAME family member 18-like n=1 Tax=Mus pahari TaxID=10093 RepID=UPI000A30E81D|nr:PRAME family member 18-like [Mus pahari]